MTYKKTSIFIGALFILTYIAFFLFAANKTLEQPEGLLINDVSRLNPTYVTEIVTNHEVAALQESLKRARNENLKVSIAGRRHSMGGHTFYKDALVLNMNSYNKVLKVDAEAKSVLVQSGATWNTIIDAIQPYDLSIPVLQDYSGFSVGGSMSVNVHQSDPNYGPLIETIKSFRLLLANGTIVNVSRLENPELFGLVIGGYGLFGVILDVTIDLTENDVYQKNEFAVDYTNYQESFIEIQNNEKIENVFARLSIVNDETLLKDVLVTTYEVTDIERTPEIIDLQSDKNLALKKFLFGLSRKYNFGKQIRWYFQKERSDMVDPPIVSRNNLDKNDQSFLEYHSSRNTDILQEYFFPVDELSGFLDTLRTTVQKKDINLLSATIRYIPVNNESFLSYSKTESFAIVLYFNVGLSEKEQSKVESWTHELLDYTNSINGTYYLPYELYANQKQIRAAYPQIDEFFAYKLQYDPQELFMNQFYEKYAHGKYPR
jgi:decaprenylphospho-beta-D-ribofuranose 2-oxidase